MKYEIAIPSYKRAQILLDKTLKYLCSKTNADIMSITVFVANEAERKEYRKLIMTPKIAIVVGRPTLRAQRNFMRKYYKVGTNVLFMDDDIEGIYQATNAKTLNLVRNINDLCSNAFDMCHQFGVSLWGISAVLNPFFMAGKGISTDLKYIIGACYGEVIRHDKFYDLELEDKEDFERTIKHFIKDGNVIRFNELAPKTNYYKEKGGMQETRTKERVKESALFLLRKYPKYCKLNTGKKNQEFVEIKLIKQ